MYLSVVAYWEHVVAKKTKANGTNERVSESVEKSKRKKKTGVGLRIKRIFSLVAIWTNKLCAHHKYSSPCLRMPICISTPVKSSMKLHYAAYFQFNKIKPSIVCVFLSACTKYYCKKVMLTMNNIKRGRRMKSREIYCAWAPLWIKYNPIWIRSKFESTAWLHKSVAIM